jgi:anti-sigma factor RsiW
MRDADRELLAEYALGLLEPEEAARVRRALEEDTEGEAELAAYLEVSDALALAFEPTPAPAGLAERVRDHVR